MTEQAKFIKETIEEAVPSSTVHIYDPDGQHFQAFVISEDFVGMPKIKQHRLVMNTLKEKFATNEVHALGLKTFTPEKWETAKQNYM
ncbi:MAG: BolA/IbaG family iron-sulfur metabolism protein [Lentisphaerales bacterium]|nr:BolA/IbaG family iron-sulfur metabolism protein [Lentisphaerales bacterium]